MEANNKKILLIDDDSFLLGIYKGKFSEAGCIVEACKNVDDALHALRGGFVPDAAVFDLAMGGKDGFAFLEELIAEKLAQGAYLMALTNDSKSEDKARAKELGAHAYVVKAEMIPDEVVKAVLDALQRKV
jgi:two-component system chemotaxis response regulator CheY